MESQGEGVTNDKMMEMDFTGSVARIAHLDTLLNAAYTGCLRLSTDNVIGECCLEITKCYVLYLS